MKKKRRKKSLMDTNKYLEAVEKKLYNGLKSGKVKSKLMNGKRVSSIPGMGYFFRTK
jgi:hypothetical protein